MMVCRITRTYGLGFEKVWLGDNFWSMRGSLDILEGVVFRLEML